MKILAKPEKFRTMFPRIYGYEVEAPPHGSAWVLVDDYIYYHEHGQTQIEEYECALALQEEWYCLPGETKEVIVASWPRWVV